ncbi:hypothetical protein MPSEU_000075200 [Mayamaea pseudoterrestris]|nr:hypothetical protein MPSEU_000075200 [Mayamaea pseudoterrestris]
MTTSNFGLDTVNISFLTNPGDKKTLPLVITPRWNDSLQFWIDWATNNRPWLNEKLLQYGAILVRGFQVNSAEDMEAAIQAYQPRLNNTYRGTSPRNLLGSTEYIFSAAEVPANYPIAQHIEMSFLPAPPKQLYFGCLKPSKSSGGETALADFRKVYEDVPLELKQKLLTKGLQYTRTHKKQGAYLTYDVSDMLGWPSLFGTDDKLEVEKMCKAENIPFYWQGDTFVSVTHSQAFQLHPITREHVWFNHTQVFHWTTFPCELWFAFKRTWEFRLLLQCLLVGFFSVIKYGLLRHKMSLDVSFGDGEAISAWEMSQIRRAIHKNMVFNRWQKGDICMIDNFAVSHGRQPTYDKGRKIAVAWSEPLQKANAVKTLEPLVEYENPQERTPTETPMPTLTAETSKALLAELHPHKKLEDHVQRAFAKDDFPDAAFHNLKSLFHEVKQKKMHHRSFSQPPVFEYK